MGYSDLNIKVQVNSCYETSTSNLMERMRKQGIYIKGRQWFVGRYVDRFSLIEDN